MTRPRMPPIPREAEVLRACLALLKARGFLVERQNTGAFKVGERFVKFGTPGRADLFAIRGGVVIFLEVKRPGNRPTPLQIQYLRNINESGAVGAWIDDARTLDAILTRVLAGWRIEIDESGNQIMISPDEDEEVPDAR